MDKVVGAESPGAGGDHPKRLPAGGRPGGETGSQQEAVSGTAGGKEAEERSDQVDRQLF